MLCKTETHQTKLQSHDELFLLFLFEWEKKLITKDKKHFFLTVLMSSTSSGKSANFKKALPRHAHHSSLMKPDKRSRCIVPITNSSWMRLYISLASSNSTSDTCTPCSPTWSADWIAERRKLQCFEVVLPMWSLWWRLPLEATGWWWHSQRKQSCVFISGEGDDTTTARCGSEIIQGKN